MTVEAVLMALVTRSHTFARAALSCLGGRHLVWRLLDEGEAVANTEATSLSGSIVDALNLPDLRYCG